MWKEKVNQERGRKWEPGNRGLNTGESKRSLSTKAKVSPTVLPGAGSLRAAGELRT